MEAGLRQAVAGFEPILVLDWPEAACHTDVGSEVAGNFEPLPPHLGLWQPLFQQRLQLPDSMEPVRCPGFGRACCRRLRSLGCL